MRCLLTALRSGCPPGLHICLSLWTCAIARVFAPARLALRAAFGRVGSHSSRNVSPFGLLMQPTAQPPCCLVPGQRPLARVRRSDPTLVFHSRGFASFAGPFGLPRFPLHGRGLPWLQRIFSVSPCLRESPVPFSPIRGPKTPKKHNACHRTKSPQQQWAGRPPSLSPPPRLCALPPYCATLRLPPLGYTFVFPFGHALSRGCSRHSRAPSSPPGLRFAQSVPLRGARTSFSSHTHVLESASRIAWRRGWD